MAYFVWSISKSRRRILKYHGSNNYGKQPVPTGLRDVREEVGIMNPSKAGGATRWAGTQTYERVSSVGAHNSEAVSWDWLCHCRKISQLDRFSCCCRKARSRLGWRSVAPLLSTDGEERVLLAPSGTVYWQSITRRPLTGRNVLSASQAQNTELLVEVGLKLRDNSLITGMICKDNELCFWRTGRS